MSLLGCPTGSSPHVSDVVPEVGLELEALSNSPVRLGWAKAFSSENTLVRVGAYAPSLLAKPGQCREYGERSLFSDPKPKTNSRISYDLTRAMLGLMLRQFGVRGMVLGWEYFVFGFRALGCGFRRLGFGFRVWVSGASALVVNFYHAHVSFSKSPPYSPLSCPMTAYNDP